MFFKFVHRLFRLYARIILVLGLGRIRIQVSKNFGAGSATLILLKLNFLFNQGSDLEDFKRFLIQQNDAFFSPPPSPPLVFLPGHKTHQSPFFSPPPSPLVFLPGHKTHQFPFFSPPPLVCSV